MSILNISFIKKLSIGLILSFGFTVANANMPYDFEADFYNKSYQSFSPKADLANIPGVDYGKYNVVGVALFSGTDFVSKAIRKLTKSEVSHVGVILANKKDENRWYCFESTGSATEVLNGQFPHVRLTEWEKVVKEYSGEVKYRLLVYDGLERTPSMSVTQLVKRYVDKSYAKNILRLFKAMFKKNRQPEKEILDDVFCSELVAQMFMDAGIMQKGISSNYIPKDFSSTSKLGLKSGISLTPEFVA